MLISTNFAEKVSQLPTNPGVYLMKDRQGVIIYVGKAKSLKNRVKSYFQKPQDTSQKTKLLVSKLADIETIITQTEKDALILENSFIKKYRPRFNVLYRDDKEYPYLRLAINESYPNLTIIRKPQKDGALYFGPFASAQAVRETLKVIHKIFPLRKCTGEKLNTGRPCIYFQLGQCLAPCCCKVPPDQYQKTVKDVQLFLQGRSSQILHNLKKRMELEAQNLNFELAAQIRDQIAGIEETLEKQSIVCLDNVDRDVFSFYREGSQMGITALFVRNGRMIGSRSFFLKRLQLPDEDVLSSFIAQYYHQGEFIPREVIIPLNFEDRSVLGEWLREKKEDQVDMICPQRGSRKDLLKMANQNAEIMFNKTRTEFRDVENILKDLQKKLHLKSFPSHIECFDISNIMGTSAVGSMVVFEDGFPLKEKYKRFRIKTVHQPDDYAMMYEVLSRHLVTLKRDDQLPNLIMVDGGKGQLSVLSKALMEHGMTSVDAIALAKGKQRDNLKKKRFSRETEKVFLPNRKNPVIFPKDSQALFLLQRLRDEAHRFAISYHKTLKKKRDFTPFVEKIPGIGTITAKAILRHFGSLEKVKLATRGELLNVTTVSEKRAKAIFDFFHPSQES